MDPPFRVKRYRGPQHLPSRPKAASCTPVHSRELAPDRIDGLPNTSAVRPPSCFVDNPYPVLAPQISPRRTQVFQNFEPLPPPVFKSARRSQPYPSIFHAEHVQDVGSPSSSFVPAPVSSPPLGLRQKHSSLSPQNVSQQSLEFHQRKLAESLFEQVCIFCISFSDILSSNQSLSLRPDLSSLLIRKYSPSTIKRYCISFLNLAQWLFDLDLDLQFCSTIELVDVLRLMHSEWSETDPDSDELQLSPLISLNTLKALRWVSNVLQLQILDSYSPIFSNLTFSSKEKCESLPLPLYMVHDLELSLMEDHNSLQDSIFKGSLLVCIWASLRFDDAQHVFWDKIILDDTSLRAACFQAKSSKSGYPFAVQVFGLIADAPQASWLLKWLEALNIVWDASILKYGPSFVPDHLFPNLDSSGAIVEPMSYAQTIAFLRRYLSTIPSLRSCAPEYTLHSAKATILSWACQFNLDSESRALQGHHKPSLQSSVNLYGRDSVHAPIQLQTQIRAQIVHFGFRPSTPLHRGAQSPAVEPAVTLCCRCEPFDLSALKLHHFKIHLTSPNVSAQEPVEIVDSPVDPPATNHIPDPELSACPLFIVTSKIVHCASWTVQSGVDFRGSRFRPKCGSPIVPDAQVSLELPSGVRFCRRKACLTALHASMPD